MKRKEKPVPERDHLRPDDESLVAAVPESNNGETMDGQKFFILEDGKLKSFSPEDYTPSTIYQMVESFAVERKFVRPEESNSVVYEGKRPSKKTVPIVLTKGDEYVMLQSWEELDTHPQQLADAQEVIGAAPVRQVFILRKK